MGKEPVMPTPSARDYVAEQLAVIAGRPVEVSDDLVLEFWPALTREEEKDAGRDRHGNFTPAESELRGAGTLERPRLLDLLSEQGLADGDRWPGGHRFAAVLTHDVDRITRWPARERWRQAANRRFSATVAERVRWAAVAGAFGVRSVIAGNDLDPFGWYMAEEEKHGFRSTFFVLTDELRKPTRHDHWYRLTDRVEFAGETIAFADAARLVQEAGWEIGLHGSYSSAEDAAILSAERARLEEAIGIEIASTRQHFLRFDAERTPGVHAAAGLKADSTVGFSTTFGCRVGIALPFFWHDHPDLLEVPITIQDVGLLRGARSSAELEEATARALRLVEFVAERGGAVTLAWHTHPDRSVLSCYGTLLEKVAELGGWGCSVADVDSWWRRRREQVRKLAASATQRTQTLGMAGSALLTLLSASTATAL
jgi:peptidoglycan/xylan/chitin deacetylase (PgdA/CDA1 family)